MSERASRGVAFGVVISVALTVCAAGCGSNGAEPDIKVSITPVAPTVSAGGQVPFAAAVSNASDSSVAWSATGGNIDQNGLFTAPSIPGQVNVTATSKADPSKSATALVTVTAPVAVGSVHVAVTSAMFSVGETVYATASVLDAGGRTLSGRTIVWTSDNTGIATVDSYGTIKGVSVGSARITATCEGVAGVSSVKVGTPVAAQTLAVDTTWSASGSPYILKGKVYIDSNVTLTIDPGVVVVGGSVQVLGSLAAVGSSSQPVSFMSVQIIPSGMSDQKPHLIDLEYVSISGGTLYAPTGNAIYGTLLVRDASISGLSSYMYVWYPLGSSVIERTILDHVRLNVGQDMRPGTGQTGSLVVRNNVFKNGAVVENWAAYGGAMVVQNNSFLDTSAVAVKLTCGYSGPDIDARNNYWGGLSDGLVPSMIFDHADDPTCVNTIPYLPTLSSPDPATPVP